MKTSTARSAARLLFWPAVALTMYGAFSPPGRMAGLLPWDKAEHFVAFYALCLLGLLAFPRTRPLVIGLALSAFGGLIEIVQALPLVHRDADWRDWLADTVAIAAVLIPMVAVRVRNSG